MIPANVMKHAKLQRYTHLRQDMNLPKSAFKYNLPHIINDTPELVLERLLLTVYVGLHITLNYLLHKYQNVCILSDWYICQLSTQGH